VTTDPKRAIRVTAVAASAQFGGTERVLLDFAARAFEHDLNLRVLTPREGPLIGVLNEIGVPAAVVPAPANLLRGSQQVGHLWSVPAALAGLAGWSRALAAHRYWADADLIYTIAFKTHFAAALSRRHPVVWHLHEFPPRTTGGVWRWLSRRWPDGLIANSAATARAWRPDLRASRGASDAEGRHAPPSGGEPRGRRLAVSRRATPPPLTVVPNGVDLDRFRPAARTGWIHQRLDLPRERRLIGMPAVLARWKGQLDVVRAFAAVARRIPDVHLVFVGGSIYDTVAESTFGPQMERHIIERNQELGERRIHLMPFQPKIERVYPEFDLVVHYSLRPEAFGRVIVESLACGVPVIAAGEGGPVEIVGPAAAGGRAEAGWLARPRDPSALAGVLEAALRLSAAELRALGARGREIAEDRYSARRFAREVAGVLREVVVNPPSQ
jgi:glycosyltransferase involved in cell wall biosynthesis